MLLIIGCLMAALEDFELRKYRGGSRVRQPVVADLQLMSCRIPQPSESRRAQPVADPVPVKGHPIALDRFVDEPESVTVETSRLGDGRSEPQPATVPGQRR